MKNYGRTTVDEFLGDMVVYRNLEPVDPRLLPLSEIREIMELPPGSFPRKTDREYARVIAHMLEQARTLDAPSESIKRLFFVGDTRMNDGSAFVNICRAGDWPGLAFIGAEDDDPARVEIVEQEEGTLYLANRWVALSDFDQFCRKRGFQLDHQAAVIIDLDKTAFGARGRNQHVIDQARIEAVRCTVGDLLGNRFDPHGFQIVYDRFNQPEFHPFTSDNQDYLAYICLIVVSGFIELEVLEIEVRRGGLSTFEQFINVVDERASELPEKLRHLHKTIYSLVQTGDPTPFKTFRYNEYQTTIERMGKFEDTAPVSQLLQHEIVITQEVREMALAWREQGALLFGLSDKPDEASIPTDDLSAQGYRAIHQTQTHAVGE